MRCPLLALAVVGAVLAVGAGGCGGEEPSSRPASPSTVALVSGEGGCDCTGEARARDRIADGRAVKRTGTVTLGG